MSYEQQMHNFIEQRLSNCLYYKDWIEAHKEEIKECKQQIEDESIDDMDKEYCAMVLNEYNKATEEINKNINEINLTTKDKVKFTEREQEIYNIFENYKFNIV